MTPEIRGGFPREAVEACLDRVALSRHFSRSPKLARFLRFTVESLLAGRADELKERTIAVEVYRRRLDYDPRTDPIVRSEAHRLRTRLASYYAREGSADPIVLEYPKGCYVPELRANASAPGPGAEGYRLIVANLEDRGAGGGDASRATSVAEALRNRLARWPGLRVMYRVSGARVAPRASDHLAADYRVEGMLERKGSRFAVAARLVRLADEQVIWSETQRFAWKRAADVADDLAAAIAATLSRGASRPRQPVVSRAHDLYVKGHHALIEYGNTFHPRHLVRGLRRLQEAIESDPEYVDALAALADLELMRLYPPRADAAQVLERARALLERALAVQPGHAPSLYLLGHVEGSALRSREALRLTESAVATGPDDPKGRTMMAARYASLGFWESAVMACDWAVALDPLWDAPFRIKAYLLTRMNELDATRVAVDELAQRGTSPPEVAIARFDLGIAEGDFARAEAELSGAGSAFPWRPDLMDRFEIALALAQALQGNRRNATGKLDALRKSGPRFWDHGIRLALALGDDELALDLLQTNPINGNYRWLATESLVRPYLQRPLWRARVDALYEGWVRDLAEVGPRLPAAPPTLAEPADLLRVGAPSSPRLDSASPS